MPELSPQFAEQSPAEGERSAPRAHIAIILAAGLAVRLYLIHRYPIIFGEDTIARLAHPDHLVLSHQLPLLQVAIHYLSVISSDPILVRYFMAVVGSVAGLGFYLAISDLVSRRVAFSASLLFVANPFILADSVVPYQEILMLAGLLFGFHFAYTRRWPLASLSVGIACLSRYEAWPACPLLALAYLRQSGWSPRTLVAAAALFGWAPLGWIVYNRGITPAGTHAIEWSSNPERMLRWAHLGIRTLRTSPLPTLLLAGVGLAVFWRRRLFEIPVYRMLIAFLALFLVAILFSAHGVGENPERVVTEREAHIPLVAVTMLAALGLGALPRYRIAITALSVGVGLWMADRYIRRVTSEPHLALSYQVARYLERQVPTGDVVAILARANDLEDYLAAVERKHGPGAVRQTLRALRRLDMGKPQDYQRIVVHSRTGKDRLVTYATLSLGRFAKENPTNNDLRAEPLRSPGWIVLWSDFEATDSTEADLAAQVRARSPRHVFQQDSVWVRLYSLGATD